jgi:hypothetical protein
MIYDLSSYVGLLRLPGSFKIGHAGPCLNSDTDMCKSLSVKPGDDISAKETKGRKIQYRFFFFFG